MKGSHQQHRDHDAASASQPLCRSMRCTDRASPPLLGALRPVLPLFHSLLADADTACLMRSSRTTALALLRGYTFRGNIFEPTCVASLRRLRDLCLACQLRITQPVLGDDIAAVDFDCAPLHLSPFPSSLTRLRIGYSIRDEQDEQEHWAALSAAACHWQHTEPWLLPHSHPEVQGARQRGTAVAAAARGPSLFLPPVPPTAIRWDMARCRRCSRG